jgi:hypothetical protein
MRICLRSSRARWLRPLDDDVLKPSFGVKVYRNLINKDLTAYIRRWAFFQRRKLLWRKRPQTR